MADESEKKEPKSEENPSEDGKKETIGDILKTLNEKQMTAVEAVVGKILEDNEKSDENPPTMKEEKTK